MDQMTRSIKGFSWGGFSAILTTALLFSALPLLTHIQSIKPGADKPKDIYLNIKKLPPPPPENRDQPEQQKIIAKKPARVMEKARRVRPEFDFRGTDFGENSIREGLVEISVTTQKENLIPTRVFPYDPDEVDQPPRYLRAVPAQYPYMAKRESIEGKVQLRFVVDLDGRAREAEVVNAEPPGFFEEAALKAIGHYKFKPAVKDGEPVMCNAALTISFVLD